ncbi:hypothetical protein EWE75_23970 [Sphingomonas populi]|uniref:Uncharacterized protein n=1 Tax=Sphingomonas populi TaxID=2484750 RepID=A0A4Q6XGN4_9SPHN|nr:hypothetical protein [Sphingomonas populi]RZF59041.1 hypothetical protein EWE75_23970 [Sphingomonas populi]
MIQNAMKIDLYDDQGKFNILGPLDPTYADWRGDYKVLWRSGDNRPRRVIYLALWYHYDGKRTREEVEAEPALRHAFGIDRMVYDKNGFPSFDEDTSPNFDANPLALLKHLPKREREAAAAHLSSWITNVYPGLLDGSVSLPTHPVMTIHKLKIGAPEYEERHAAVDRAWHMGLDWAN